MIPVILLLFFPYYVIVDSLSIGAEEDHKRRINIRCFEYSETKISQNYAERKMLVINEQYHYNRERKSL